MGDDLKREGQELQKGDKVVMHSCMEAHGDYNYGKIYRCRTDEMNVEWTSPNVVWLEGYSGAFSAECLQKVRLESDDLREGILEMSPQKRIQLLEDLALVFCDTCGYDHPKEGYCTCSKDI